MQIYIKNLFSPECTEIKAVIKIINIKVRNNAFSIFVAYSKD